MPTAKKEVAPFKPTTAADKKAVALVETFKVQIAELKEQLTWEPEKLDAMLLHVEEKEVVKGAKTKCTNMRTAITNAHKEAKNPYLQMGKLIDGIKNECIALVRDIEVPIDEAYARRKEEEEKQAKLEQEKKDKAANEETERLRQILIANGIDPDAEENQPAEFEEKTVTLSVSEKNHIEGLKKLLGPKLFRQMVVDGNGTAYNLEVTVKRSEIDDGDEE